MNIDAVTKSDDIAHMLEGIMETYVFRNEWVDKRGLQSIDSVYSVPHLNLSGLKSHFSSSENCRLWDVKTKHLVGIYIESGEHSFFAYQPNPENVTLESAGFNQSLDVELSNELISFGEENNIFKLKKLNFETFKALLVTYSFALSHLFGIDIKELEQLKILNSHKVLVDNYQKLSKGISINFASHLGAFSLIYFTEIKAIAYVCKDTSGISIHDVATNTAHFPLLLSALEKEGLLELGLKSITCSDIDIQLAKNYIRQVSEFSNVDHSNVEIVHVNLLEDNLALEDADVITANDILEHFSEEDSRRILQNLWKRTKRLLIIHVPIEDEPDEIYGHRSSFNKDKLEDWAAQLDNCTNVASLLNLCEDASIRDGFLFLLRTGF